MKRYLFLTIFLLFVTALVFKFSSCGSENVITQIFVNEVAAKDRLESANSQAVNKYGSNTKLVLIMGKNVKTNGKTDISALSVATSLDSVGAWLYVYRVPSDSSLRIYTPNPVPGATDCIELTAAFDVNALLTLIPDTSARNMITGALSLVTQANVSINTPVSSLVNSDVSLGYANSISPVIKFDQSFIPDTSFINGSVFFNSGSSKTINMFLIPAAGTLHLPDYIQNLLGFPEDLWVVNYKKLNTAGAESNLILGTVVQSNQEMGIGSIGLSSKVINLSKFVNE
ncbi:MAG: hypothetical protein EHM58_11340 [Ignavibacteriae bacterium]|nr:MAG: hypothetical protein EHM58_11340 [Ignavibacteriota bacterium]